MSTRFALPPIRFPVYLLTWFLGLFHISIADSLRSKIFEAWMGRMDAAGGVHTWDTRHSSRFVFQEWTVLLKSVQDADLSERQRMGERVSRYFLNPPLQPLGRTGTQLPVPGSEGDYDMTLVACFSFLGLFEADTVLLPNPVFVHLLRTSVVCLGNRRKANLRLDPGNFQKPKTIYS